MKDLALKNKKASLSILMVGSRVWLIKSSRSLKI